MLKESERKSLEAMRYIADGCLKKNDINLTDVGNLQACWPNILQRPGFVRSFIGWLGRMAVLPDVLKEAGVWGWALKKFSNVVGKW